jgi:uncharacterized protein
MIGKLHVNENKMLFACCDKELINKEIIFNETTIKLSEKFYGSKEITTEKVLENINKCTQANIFGKNVCELLIDNNLILKEQVLDVNGIPHVQIYKI